MIDDITNFVFLEDELERADVILIPGGSYPELPERAAQLWREGYAPYVVPSGRYSITLGKFAGVKSKPEQYAKPYTTECGFYTDVLLARGAFSGRRKRSLPRRTPDLQKSFWTRKESGPKKPFCAVRAIIREDV